MAQDDARSYRMNPDDPRAPTAEEWASMAPEERARVVAELPADMPWELHPPEGDPHRIPKNRAADALGRFFRRTGRRVYVSSELTTYYPGEPRFCPDVLAVMDVDDRERMKWVVSEEGRGLDWILEVFAGGDRKKDFERNVELYARLGVPEYFIFDRPALRLHAFRLAAGGRTYQRIVPQGGRYASAVLGLELMVRGAGIRFLYGGAPLPELDEVVELLENTVNELLAARDEAERRAEEMARDAETEARRAADAEARASAEAGRAGAEAARARAAEARVAELERRLAELSGSDPEGT